jgi:hypothetical protein
MSVNNNISKALFKSAEKCATSFTQLGIIDFLFASLKRNCALQRMAGIGSTGFNSYLSLNLGENCLLNLMENESCRINLCKVCQRGGTMPLALPSLRGLYFAQPFSPPNKKNVCWQAATLLVYFLL